MPQQQQGPGTSINISLNGRDGFYPKQVRSKLVRILLSPNDTKAFRGGSYSVRCCGLQRTSNSAEKKFWWSSSPSPFSPPARIVNTASTVSSPSCSQWCLRAATASEIIHPSPRLRPWIDTPSDIGGRLWLANIREKPLLDGDSDGHRAPSSRTAACNESTEYSVHNRTLRLSHSWRTRTETRTETKNRMRGQQ